MIVYISLFWVVTPCLPIGEFGGSVRSKNLFLFLAFVCYNTRDYHFRQSVVFSSPSLQHKVSEAVTLSARVALSLALQMSLYPRSPTQYSFAGCELNSLTQGPTVNTLGKGGELSTS